MLENGLNNKVVIEPKKEEELNVEHEENIQLETDLNYEVPFEVELRDGKEFEL